MLIVKEGLFEALLFLAIPIMTYFILAEGGYKQYFLGASLESIDRNDRNETNEKYGNSFVAPAVEALEK